MSICSNRPGLTRRNIIALEEGKAGRNDMRDRDQVVLPQNVLRPAGQALNKCRGFSLLGHVS